MKEIQETERKSRNVCKIVDLCMYSSSELQNQVYFFSLVTLYRHQLIRGDYGRNLKTIVQGVLKCDKSGDGL